MAQKSLTNLGRKPTVKLVVRRGRGQYPYHVFQGNPLKLTFRFWEDSGDVTVQSHELYEEVMAVHAPKDHKFEVSAKRVFEKEVNDPEMKLYFPSEEQRREYEECFE